MPPGLESSPGSPDGLVDILGVGKTDLTGLLSRGGIEHSPGSSRCPGGKRPVNPMLNLLHPQKVVTPRKSQLVLHPNLGSEQESIDVPADWSTSIDPSMAPS